MRLIGVSMSGMTEVSNANPLGWRGWLLGDDGGEGTLLECKSLVESGKYAGVYLIGACGKTKTLMPCGEYANGEPCMTGWAGHDDGDLHPIVRRFVAEVRTVVSFGLPRTMDGLDALERDMLSFADTPLETSLDATGSNVSYRVKAAAACCPRVRLESRSRVGHEVHPPETLYMTTATRAREILQAGGSLGDDIVIYTGGKNRWIEPEAIGHEKRCLTVVQPIETIGGE